MSKGVPAQRGPLLSGEDFTIVATYGSGYRGYVQCYLLAQDVWRLGRLRWVMETSMLKTLAAKHSSTVTKMARKYKTRVATDDGPRICFQVTVPRDGRKPLANDTSVRDSSASAASARDGSIGCHSRHGGSWSRSSPSASQLGVPLSAKLS